MTTNSAPLQLAAHGLSRKDLDVLRSLLSLYRPRLNRECHLCGVDEHADVHLIDIDDPVGWASWLLLRDRGQCIVLSHDAVEAAPTLSKPLRGPALLAVLSEFIFRNQPPDDTVRLPAYVHEPAIAAMPSAPGRTLIDLLETGAIDSCVRIVVNIDDALWIDPDLRQYLLGVPLMRLKSFLRTPLRPSQLVPVARHDFREHARQIRPKTLIRLQWSAALACSDGRLIAALESGAAMQLAAWPDMEAHSPKFFRLAGLLVKQAVNFDAIVAMTGIDEATVADFLNASYRCGILRWTTPREKPSGRFAFSGRGIVARLRERLGI